ncbi:hypothetical protein [Chamaesiphon sp. VAR_48_metabat_135_sub]|uniref:hypothetical protein n=1 Tax=Chamaesiphon sp. VAR_48_metabat_135_sub TaxID=2964699 RepID=UPI00286C970F|nr:hypothetical protein [Chamaesiphon sp. VAR_48_metabat_135_sub]
MSGTYQSRVFTFINKRTNRFKDTCAKGLRHIKVAVVWSGQILLYPLHLLAQTTKIFQPQLAAPPLQRSLPQPVSDINIEQALDLVAGAGYPIKIAMRDSLTVDDRSIIDENLWNTTHLDTEIEDWELTHSSRSSHQLTRPKPIIRGLSSLLIDRQLVLVSNENEILNLLTLSQQQEIRRRIGCDLAAIWDRWDTHKLSHNRSRQQLSANRQLLLDRADTTSPQVNDRNLSSSNLFERWNNWLQKIAPKSTSENSSISPISIDRIERKVAPQIVPVNYLSTPQPPKIDQFWELPQLPPIVENLSPSQEHPVRDKIVKLQPDWLKQWLNYYRDYLYIPADVNSQIVHQPAEFQLIPIEPRTVKVKSKQIHKQQSLTEENAGKMSVKSVLDLESSQDWIEADSEIIGYSTSPIAKFLAWLDRLILKIENWSIEIWNTIVNKLAKNR